MNHNISITDPSIYQSPRFRFDLLLTSPDLQKRQIVGWVGIQQRDFHVRQPGSNIVGRGGWPWLDPGLIFLIARITKKKKDSADCIFFSNSIGLFLLANSQKISRRFATFEILTHPKMKWIDWLTLASWFHIINKQHQQKTMSVNCLGQPLSFGLNLAHQNNKLFSASMFGGWSNTVTRSIETSYWWRKNKLVTVIRSFST